MVSSRRTSRACSKAKYHGKRRRLQALRPVHHSLSWGQASARRRSSVCPRAKHISSFCENVAILPRGTICSQSVWKRSWPKWRTDCRGVSALGVARAQADAPQFIMRARFGEAALAQCARGPGAFSRFGRILPGFLGGLNICILAAKNRDRSGVHDGIFALGDFQ